MSGKTTAGPCRRLLGGAAPPLAQPGRRSPRPCAAERDMSIEPATAPPVAAVDHLQQLEAALRRQAILREVLEALASEPDLDALLRLVVGRITAAMEADRSSL